MVLPGREPCRPTRMWGMRGAPTFGLAVAHPPRPPQGCIRREGTSEAAPEAVRQAVGGGCQSGWGRLLLVTNAMEAGTWRQAELGRRLGALEWGVEDWHKASVFGGGGGTSPPSNASLPPPPPLTTNIRWTQPSGCRGVDCCGGGTMTQSDALCLACPGPAFDAANARPLHVSAAQ